MGGGYVLDFSNKTFQEFILENVNIDVDNDKYFYKGSSKANRLRAFWEKESNPIVGELVEHLIEYWRVKKLLDQKEIKPKEQELFNECKNISQRLTELAIRKQNQYSSKKDEFPFLRSDLLLELDRFATLTSSEDKKKRGFLLENLLERIFALHEIPAQKSFKRNEGGEQIDGAFKIESSYFLVECKWTQKLTDIRQLDSLYGKISRSGKHTLGLFLSINGWSSNVNPLLKQNQDKSIILMDGYDLRSTLEEHKNIDLKSLLLKKLDCLHFEGEPFYSAVQFLHDQDIKN
jgi:Restriction endonuclease